MYEDLYYALNEYVANNTENYPYRSADWYRVRYFSFGGSELANLMGLSKKSYISYDEFFEEKFKSQQGTGRHIKQYYQMIMDWGTLFEPVHRMALEDLLCCSIQEASMCKGTGILKGCHQSPDGLAVVNTEKFLYHVYNEDIVDRSVFDRPFVTVLFEYKSPYMRKILPHSVPDYYIGQIKLGLSMFRPCNIACYSESLFRICTARQWTTTSFNTHILLQRKYEVPDDQPLYVGMIEFDDLGRVSMGIDSGDLSGTMTQAHFIKMMDLLRMNSMKHTIHIFKFEELAAAKAKVKELNSSNRAYFCWKLINMQHTAVEKSQGFENVVAMYVNLGNRALIKYSSAYTQPEQELNDIREFTKKVRLMGLPLVPGNFQDAWYNKYEAALIDLYERYLLDDWQSFYVLLTLLSRSRNSELRKRADVFVYKAKCACATDDMKKELLQYLLQEIPEVSVTEALDYLALSSDYYEPQYTVD